MNIKSKKIFKIIDILILKITLKIFKKINN